MMRIKQIGRDQRVKRSLATIVERQQELVDLITAIQQIPAPTFAEKDRAGFIEAQFSGLGLEDVTQDAVHNAYGRLPGKSNASSRPVIVSAHSDTVFPDGTDLTVRQQGSRLYGPGIGDNSAGDAGIIHLAKTLQEMEAEPQADIWFVCNVGEEGLGDLRGMREVVKRFGREGIYIVVEGGSYGQIMHEAIGVRRYRVKIVSNGGHSWGSFGQPSAIHELGHLIAAICEMSVPAKPRTTFNVGLVDGGTSINTIAAEASLHLDLRSEDSAELGRLVEQFKKTVRQRQLASRRAGREVDFVITQVGNRPAGRIPRGDPVVQWAKEALQFVGCSPITFIAGSTDANIPLSKGLQSVCVGLTQSGNSHRVDEFIELEYLPMGMQQLMLLTLAASGID